MSEQELDELLAEQNLRFEREYKDVQGMFRYMVSIPGGFTYLCQKYDLQTDNKTAVLKLTDVWMHNAAMTKRLVPEVRLLCSSYEIVDTKGDE